MPKLTVIIPVYNKIRYLSGLLEQVMGQTFADFECLLIDDGSTDGSGAVCDAFAEKDPRFRVFHIPNGGVSRARNLGLDHAVGEYITFLDADDQICPEHLQNLKQCASNSGADFVIGNLQKFWEDRDVSEVIAMPYQGKVPMAQLLPNFARVQQETGIYGFCVGKLFRQELTEQLRFDTGIKLAEDLDFYMGIYPKLDSVYFDQTPTYSYLQAAENSSMLDADDRIDYLAQLKIQLKIVGFLRNQQAFTGENQQIMISRLYDYVFFSLFHCPTSEIRKMCKQIRSLALPPRNKEQMLPTFRVLVLGLYECRMDWVLVALLKVYRSIRRIKRCIKKRS